MEKFLTAQQLSESIGYKLSTIYSWSHRKVIPRVAKLRLLRFRESEVIEWLAQKNTEKASPPQRPQHRPKVRARRSINKDIDEIVDFAKKEVLK